MCTNPYARIYIQYKCLSNDEFLTQKQSDGYKIVGCATLIAAIFSLSMRYILSKAHHDFDDWDKETCTPADYTIEMDITPMMVAKYRAAKNQDTSIPSLDETIKSMLLKELNKEGFYVFKRF